MYLIGMAFETRFYWLPCQQRPRPRFWATTNPLNRTRQMFTLGAFCPANSRLPNTFIAMQSKPGFPVKTPFLGIN